MKSKYFFFDLDHTLVDTDCECEWKKMMIQEGGEGEDQHKQLNNFLELHHRGKLPQEEYIAFLMYGITGKQTKKIFEQAEYNFHRNIKNKIFSDAKVIITNIKKDDGKVVMLSGSVKPIIEPVARYLGVDDIVCTELEILNDVYTGNLIGDFCVLQGKVNKAKDYCLAHNISLSEVDFYGDSHSDVPIMEQAGNATVVNPKASMKKIADEQGWDTVRWEV